MIELNRVYHDDVMSFLARVPNEFVDCCVTSPPYFNLRNYHTKPQIWAGDPDHKHVWKGRSGTRRSTPKEHNGDRKMRPVSDAFCECGAWKGELGLEPTIHLYIDHLMIVFAEIKRVMKKTGTLFVNIGDTYNSGGNNRTDKEDLSDTGAINMHNQRKGRVMTDTKIQGVPRKSLMAIPSRFEIAMLDRLGFCERNEIHWLKNSAQPSPHKDRFTVDFEKIFFFTKRPTGYYFEQQFEKFQSVLPRSTKILHAKERNKAVPINRAGNGSAPGRNMRTTWAVNFENNGLDHIASYPSRLVELPIICGSPVGGVILDPFMGSFTTAVVAHKLDRKFIGCEIDRDMHSAGSDRINELLLSEQPRLI